MHQTKEQQIVMLKNSIEDLKKRNRKLQNDLDRLNKIHRIKAPIYDSMKEITNEKIKLYWEPQVLSKMKELEALLSSLHGGIKYGYK